MNKTSIRYEFYAKLIDDRKKTLKRKVLSHLIWLDVKYFDKMNLHCIANIILILSLLNFINNVFS